MKHLLPILFVVILLGTACKTSRTSMEDPALIKDHFIVQLADNTKPEALLEAFSAQDLQLVKPISAKMNLWLFRYDQQKKKPEKMLARIQKSPLVKQAEFDKKLGSRR
ncbi:MAG: hypothetical protein AAFQ68_11625 [Bacteroidota bacterium]